MENLAIHIEYLLLRHDCVVMPGFGAFINVYTAPEIDFEKQIITPMKREIRFNAALRSDDGLLANSYARKYEVSYTEGVMMVTKTISSLLSHLKDEKEATFGQLGIIRFGEEGNIIFEPFQNRFSSAEVAGLRPVPLAWSASALPSSSNAPHSEAESYASISGYPENGEAGDKELERFRRMNFRRNYYLPLNKMAVRISACVMALIAMALSVILPYEEDRRHQDQASVMPIEKIIDTARQKKEAIAKITASDPSESIRVDTLAFALPKSTEETIRQPEDKYYLIVGTFRTEEEAATYISTHHRDGYELVAVPSKKLCRVSAKSGNDREAMQRELNSDRFRAAYGEGWIWVK